VGEQTDARTEQTDARIEHNNTVFRDANEGISNAAETLDHDLERVPLLCECPAEDCVEVVRLTEDDYTAVRANPRYLITAPGHEEAEEPVGHVVTRPDGYVVVEK
jgi:hypothetical protein